MTYNAEVLKNAEAWWREFYTSATRLRPAVTQAEADLLNPPHGEPAWSIGGWLEVISAMEETLPPVPDPEVRALLKRFKVALVMHKLRGS